MCQTISWLSVVTSLCWLPGQLQSDDTTLLRVGKRQYVQYAHAVTIWTEPGKPLPSWDKLQFLFYDEIIPLCVMSYFILPPFVWFPALFAPHLWSISQSPLVHLSPCFRLCQFVCSVLSLCSLSHLPLVFLLCISHLVFYRFWISTLFFFKTCFLFSYLSNLCFQHLC